MTVNQAESYLDHPMFHKAMQNMQNGDWDSGLGEIENLMQSYPLEPELRSLRQEMMLRAKVDADEQVHVSQTRKKRVRNLIIRLSVVAILVILAIFVARTYSLWFQDQVQLTRQAVDYQLVVLDLDTKMRDAEDYLRAGQVDSAFAKINEIEAVDPDYPGLGEAKQEAARLQDLDAQYAEALALILFSNSLANIGSARII